MLLLLLLLPPTCLMCCVFLFAIPQVQITQRHHHHLIQIEVRSRSALWSMWLVEDMTQTQSRQFSLSRQYAQSASDLHQPSDTIARARLSFFPNVAHLKPSAFRITLIKVMSHSALIEVILWSYILGVAKQTNKQTKNLHSALIVMSPAFMTMTNMA